MDFADPAQIHKPIGEQFINCLPSPYHHKKKKERRKEEKTVKITLFYSIFKKNPHCAAWRSVPLRVRQHEFVGPVAL